MAARAVWKGVVSFGDVELPVKLYSAVEDRKVHFRLLHAKDHHPVEQRMVHPGTGEVVPREGIRRGLEVERGVFVVLDPEELDELTPPPDRTIEITRFVDPAEINHQWYRRPYFLGPDGDDDGYFALAEAIGAREVEGVARWTMRKKRYLGALRVRGDHLMLIALRPAEEVVQLPTIEPAAGRRPGEREVALADQLVGTLAGPFDPAEWRDEYRDRVLAYVEKRARGERVALPKARRAARGGSLEAALSRSLAAAEAHG